MTAADGLWCACVAAEIVALVMALRALEQRTTKTGTNYSKVMHLRGIAARTTEPLAPLLAFAALSDVAIAVGRIAVLDGEPRPFGGLARGWYHLESALVIGWPCGLALTCRRAFTLDRRPWWRSDLGAAVVGAGAAAIGILVALHPVGRGLTAAVLLACELVGVAAAWLAVARGWPLPWRAEHRALVVLAAIETVVLILGPFSHDLFTSWATLGRVPYTAGFAAVAVVLARGEEA